MYIYPCVRTSIPMYVNTLPLTLPQGAPRPIDAFSICHKAIQQECMPASGGYWNTHRNLQLWISKMRARIVLIMTKYDPVEKKNVPWLSHKQNQLHGHSPFTLNVSHSCPCCCNCGMNVFASDISICFITQQWNLKIHWLVSKAVSDVKTIV